MKKYQKLIKDFADQKIKCFSEHVIPVKKMDIEFICADNGAHQSIEDALKAALGDQITCEHVNCQAIEEQMHNMSTSTPSVHVGL